jgi:hypothetical protein
MSDKAFGNEMKNLLSKWFGAKPEIVPFYDSGAKRVVSIPKSELSECAIFVDLAGHGRVYIDASQAKLSDKILHPPFEGDLRLAIELLVQDLADVYPMTYKQWEDGFRTEPRLEKEIAGWIHLSAILKAQSGKHSFDFAQRKACMGLLLACFNGPRETVRNRCDVRLFSNELVEKTIESWYEGSHE